MSLEIKVPPVGESISEVVLSQWKKNDGDFVEMDEVIAELESDKATFELTAEAAGTLRIIAQEGDTLPIGAAVCSIEEGTGSSKKTEEKSAEKETEEVSKPASVSDKSYASGVPSPAAAKILSEKGVDPATLTDQLPMTASGKVQKFRLREMSTVAPLVRRRSH